MVEELEESNNIWTTEKVKELITQFKRTGVLPRDNPFHERKIEWRKANLNYGYTLEELLEKKKCENIFYLANTYCHVMTDDGYVKINLDSREYQKKVLHDFIKYDKNVWLASRQIGKSIITAIFIVWFILNHPEKNILILSKTGDKVKELMRKVKSILKRLPFFLKPGIRENNVFTMEFEHDVLLVAEKTTPDSGASFTVHLLYIDEFALLPENIINEFYRTAYPTISSSETAKIIITSTPRGMNKFWEIYTGALEGKNYYNPLRTDYWEVPNHDEEWKKRQIADLGSEEDFNQEFGCQFLSGSKMLLRPKQAKKLKKMAIEFVHRDIEVFDDLDIVYGPTISEDGVQVTDSLLKWHPKFNLDSLFYEETRFALTIDLAGGEEGDFTVVNIFQILPMTRDNIENVMKRRNFTSEKDFFKLVQVGIFRSNTTGLDDLAVFLYHLIIDVMEQENLKAVLEMNFDGKDLINRIGELYGEKNEIEEDHVFVKFTHSQKKGEKKSGIKVNAENKKKGGNLLIDKIKINQIVPLEKTTINELLALGKNKKGSFESQIGHDDAGMTCVNLTHYFETIDYSDQIEEILEYCSDSFKEYIANILETEIAASEEDSYADVLI